MIAARALVRAVLLAVALLGATAAPAVAQPKPVDHVSIRAQLAVEESSRRVEREGWTLRHDGPWLFTNDEWTNQVGVSFFPAGTEYWVTVLIEDCVGCEYELRFFDEGAGGYFPMNGILSAETDGSLVRASGRFAADRDMDGELYVQMTGGGALYPTYIVLAQIR